MSLPSDLVEGLANSLCDMLEEPGNAGAPFPESRALDFALDALNIAVGNGVIESYSQDAEGESIFGDDSEEIITAARVLWAKRGGA